jgi:hypothetical protein
MLVRVSVTTSGLDSRPRQWTLPFIYSNISGLTLAQILHRCEWPPSGQHTYVSTRFNRAPFYKAWSRTFSCQSLRFLSNGSYC